MDWTLDTCIFPLGILNPEHQGGVEVPLALDVKSNLSYMQFIRRRRQRLYPTPTLQRIYAFYYDTSHHHQFYYYYVLSIASSKRSH